MNDSSTSGAITSAFENISTVFTAHSEIASGGFNCLYKAQRYGKWYVLKGLKPEFRNSAVHQELLAKEFELGIKMNHPHIAQTVGLDTDPLAGPCIVMEYVDGATLKEFLQTNPSAKTRLKIAHELLSAMAYFHGLQIVHRDLKPDNILITRNGHNVKLIDFGLADSDYHGVLKQPAGSDRYAAPEQKEGKEAIDCRADIYAFGKILRQLFPHRYGAICRKCVQPDRNKRYNNAEEIRKHFEQRRWHTLFVFLLLIIICIFVTLPTILKHISIPIATNNKSFPSEPIIQRDTLVISQNLESNTPSQVSPTQRPVKSANLSVRAQRIITNSIDSIFQPHWDWIKSVEKGTIIEKDLGMASSNHPGPFNQELMDAIIHRTLQQCPECDTLKWQLETLYSMYYVDKLNKLGFYTIKVRQHLDSLNAQK